MRKSEDRLLEGYGKGNSESNSIWAFDVKVSRYEICGDNYAKVRIKTQSNYEKEGLLVEKIGSYKNESKLNELKAC